MSTVVRRTSLRDILIQRGFAPPDQVDRLLERAAYSQHVLQDLLIAEGVIQEATLAQALAEQCGVPFLLLDNHHLDHERFSAFAVEHMQRHCFLPLDIRDGILIVAVPDPCDLPALDHLERTLERSFDIVVAPRSAILTAIASSSQNSQVVARVDEELRPVLVQENAQGEEVLSADTVQNDQSPVVRLVNTLIMNALQKRASDIHIEPTATETEVRYRIDGALYLAMEPLDLRYHNPLVSRIKIMAELDIAERRVPQDGRFKIRLETRSIDFRVSVLPSAHGESVVIRILARDTVASVNQGLRLESLGIRPDDLRKLRRAVTAAYGMVLVTGPTGSGKTTTLYAALSEVNTKEDKIITIEDPVEYQLKGVIQIPVNEKKGLTFAKGLRSILRHDPDKIMVGEIRDNETAQIAIQSALTGHLVFTTVHANNAFDVIGRFVNMGIEPYNFVSALNCIMAQRLLRTICPFCKVPVSLTLEQCEEWAVDYALFRDRPAYEGKGCAECHGLGYRGRTTITEFLGMTDAIKDMILSRCTTTQLRETALSYGMATLREAGIEKVLQGVTTVREVNRMTFVG